MVLVNDNTTSNSVGSETGRCFAVRFLGEVRGLMKLLLSGRCICVFSV